MSGDDLVMVLASIARPAATSTTARRYCVMVKGSYLLGCRVSELCRLRWKDVEPLAEGGNVRLLGKGSKPRTIRVSTATLELFESLGRGKPEDWLFPSNKRNGPLTRKGVDVFTLSATLGHSSTGTTSPYVLAESGESSSLNLG